MSALDHKIDFSVLLVVNKANPNGDPLNGNRPRQNYEGFGEISDVAIKRKIRNRLQDAGETIFVQSDDRKNDNYKSLRERAEGNIDLKEADKKKDEANFVQIACGTWLDVRAFGQVFAFKGNGAGKGVSVGIRGPVTVQEATSIDPIDIATMQITKSVNSETSEKRGSDTMGMKHRVDFGFYRFNGSINVQLAEKTGFSNDDAEKIKEALVSLFENDASSARPEGSMEVYKVYWWSHKSKLGQYSAAKVHHSLVVNKKATVDIPRKIGDYDITLAHLDGLECEIIDGR